MAYITVKRPVLLSILLVKSYIFLVLFSMGMLLSPETKRLGDFFPALFGLLVAFRFIALTGVWYMKRWGAELFMITFGASMIKDIVFDSVSVLSVLWQVGLIVAFAVYYKRMDKNL
jgi:hypothetical protein